MVYVVEGEMTAHELGQDTVTASDSQRLKKERQLSIHCIHKCNCM